MMTLGQLYSELSEESSRVWEHPQDVYASCDKLFSICS